MMSSSGDDELANSNIDDALISSNKQLSNGHDTMEKDHASTENDVATNQNGFTDESTECAICLGPLHDNPEMGDVIELTTCGHLWHLSCLKQQIAQAQPNPAQRLVLTGCRCAKCGVVCDHPALRHLTRKTDALLTKVNEVLRDQLNISTEKELEEARKKYAVYLCSNCSEPYFGGTIDCADTEDGLVPPNERLCVACAPNQLTHLQCRHPLEHRGFHVWKCRYCCRVATHVCYGTVHFCQACHKRNSERVAIQQQKQRQRRSTSNANNGPPGCLTAIPCPGGDLCPFPKPPGQSRHKNGSSSDCEQVYYCGWCESNPGEQQQHAFVEPPGSPNLLRNGCGQEGPYVAWTKLTRNRRFHWQVEQSDTPLSETITTNFVSTFQWCVMAQSVKLHQVVRNPSNVRLEVSAKYMGRTDCPSVFCMEAIVLDAQGYPIARQATPLLPAPADFWERTSLTLPPTRGAHEVVMIVRGKDERFWQGNYGSKVTDCKVRILGEPNELQQVMLPDAQQPAMAAAAVDGLQRRVGREQQQHVWWRAWLVEIVLPVVCVVILTWLIQ